MVRLVDPQRRPPPNYFSRREQWRLLMLIVPLGVVMVLMARLRNPETADRLNSIFTEETKPRPVVAETVPVVAAAGVPQLFPGIDPALLRTIEDNTYFRIAETGAWFHFFALVKGNDVDPSESVEVGYVQLVDQPGAYRGKLVTVRGTIRQITSEKPAANDLGIDSYYRVVVQPASGGSSPIIVYCLELPAGVLPGEEVSLPATITGLFFKKHSYKWRDGLGIAPVIVARNLISGDGVVASAGAPIQPDADAATVATVEIAETNTETVSEDSVSTPIENQVAIQKMLALAGWDTAQLAKFDEGDTFSDAQRIDALELLRRLRTIDFDNFDDWYKTPPPNYEIENPDDVRGVFHRLLGVVTKVTAHKLDPADADRLEMPEYFECEFAADNLAGTVTIITARVPKDWLKIEKISDRASAKALLIKRLTDETPPRSLWLAKDIAWHPGRKSSVDQSVSLDDAFRDSRDPLLGKSLLGLALVDVGQLDLVESRGRIRPQERDIFYQMMDAAGKIGTATLVRIATDNLPVVKDEWERQVLASSTRRREALAREVARLAGEGRYSAAHLFNDPERQIGRLFVFDGTARRAVRVEVGGQQGEDSSDIAERYGIDHYYELEVFTNDSQNYPLVFCVRELPDGFPTGGSIHVPVRVAGFFFKDWLYRTGRPASDENGKVVTTAGRAQYSPLLIGRAPIVLPAEQGGAAATQYIVGAIFLLALAGILTALAVYARGDRRFRERTLARNFSLPPGQSLNELNVPAAAEPMKE